MLIVDPDPREKGFRGVKHRVRAKVKTESLYEIGSTSAEIPKLLQTLSCLLGQDVDVVSPVTRVFRTCTSNPSFSWGRWCDRRV